MKPPRGACVALVLAVSSTSLALARADPITEAEAVGLFLEQSPQARRLLPVGPAVEADLRLEARLANPAIGYQVEDAAGVRDEFLTVQQELPVTGRRGLLGERAAIAAESAGLAAGRGLQIELYELQRSFYEVLYRERVLERLGRGTRRLERTVEILARREGEGEGSGYDVLRAEQELAELRMQAEAARAALLAARSRFGSFFDASSGIATAPVAGDLLPVGPLPEVGVAVERALAQRLDLRSLSAERRRLELERRAARRLRFPEPTLTAGWKRTEATGFSDTGYLFGVTVPLPVFDRGRLDGIRAESAGERVALEAEILTRRIRAEVQAAVAREQAARRAARTYGAEVEQRAAELHEIARLRYDEGEGGILELLDAHRTSLAMMLQALAAEYEARSAELERRRVTGNEVKP